VFHHLQIVAKTKSSIYLSIYLSIDLSINYRNVCLLIAYLSNR